MSDAGGTRLTLDDDELHPPQPAQNPLAPYGYERVGDGYYPPLPPGVNRQYWWQMEQRPYASGLPKLAEKAGGSRFAKPSDVFGAAAEAAGNFGANLAHGLWQAGPGTFQKVMTGELQPGTREFNEAAANTALTYGALGTPIPRPAGSLGMFGGPRSRTAPREKLKEAQAMDDLAQQRMKEEFRPYYAEDFRDPIFEHTGWAKSPDGTGTWNYIIPDAGAEIINLDHPLMGKLDYVSPFGPEGNKTMYSPHFNFGGVKGKELTVGDILKHDYLYKAYPDLKDIKVKPTGVFDTSLGGYDPVTDTLHLGYLTKDDMRSVMMHELQHAIQRREGFARGGNMNEFLPPDFAETKKAADKDMATMNDFLRGEGINPYTFRQYHGIGEHTAPDRQYIRGAEADAIEKASSPYFLKEYTSVLDNYNKHINMRSEAFRKYEALIGEVQSRSTQAMLHAGRWDRPAWEIGELQWSSDGKHTIVPYTPTQQQIYRPQSAPPPPRPRPGPPVGQPGNPPISLDPL